MDWNSERHWKAFWEFQKYARAIEVESIGEVYKTDLEDKTNAEIAVLFSRVCRHFWNRASLACWDMERPEMALDFPHEEASFL